VHIAIRPGVPKFRHWWTIVCGTGAVCLIYLSYYAPGTGDRDRELLARLFAYRTLELAAEYESASPAVRFVLGVPTIEQAIEFCLPEYETARNILSDRGLLEYAVLLAESGRTNEARSVFAHLKRGFSATDQPSLDSVTNWGLVNPQLGKFVASNDASWRSGAWAIADIYYPEGRIDPGAAQRVGDVLAMLGRGWLLPQLVRNMSHQTQPTPASLSTNELAYAMPRRGTALVPLSVSWWLLLFVAMVLAWLYRSALGLCPSKPRAFRYFNRHSTRATLIVFVRGQFYTMIIGYSTAAWLVPVLPYWFALAYYDAVVALFPAYYALARLCPSWRFIRKAFGLGQRQRWPPIVAMTAMLWLARAGLEWGWGWLARLMPYAVRLTDSLRPEVAFNPSWSALGLMLIVSAVLAPCGEELFFRGILYTSLRARFGIRLGIVLSASVFALIHHYSALSSALILAEAVVWAYSFERTGSLIPALVVHCLGNLFWFLGVWALYNPTW
jgi:membrane protease YdiL (CAAX protease family)